MKSKSVNRGGKVCLCLRPWRLGNSNVQGRRWQLGERVAVSAIIYTCEFSCINMFSYPGYEKGIIICEYIDICVYISTQRYTPSILCYVWMQEWIYRHKWEYRNHILGLENILKMKILKFIWIHRQQSNKRLVIETRVSFFYF